MIGFTKHIWFKSIALVLVVSSLALDIAWAHPDRVVSGATLSAPDYFRQLDPSNPGYSIAQDPAKVFIALGVAKYVFQEQANGRMPEWTSLVEEVYTVKAHNNIREFVRDEEKDKVKKALEGFNLSRVKLIDGVVCIWYEHDRGNPVIIQVAKENSEAVKNLLGDGEPIIIGGHAVSFVLNDKASEKMQAAFKEDVPRPTQRPAQKIDPPETISTDNSVRVKITTVISEPTKEIHIPQVFKKMDGVLSYLRVWGLKLFNIKFSFGLPLLLAYALTLEDGGSGAKFGTALWFKEMIIEFPQIMPYSFIVLAALLFIITIFSCQYSRPYLKDRYAALLMKSEDWRARETAMELATEALMVDRGDEKAYDLMIQALGDPHTNVRIAAIFGLSLDYHQEAESLLIRLLSDLDPRIRRGAARSLSIRGWRPNYDRIRSLEQYRDRVKAELDELITFKRCLPRTRTEKEAEIRQLNEDIEENKKGYEELVDVFLIAKGDYEKLSEQTLLKFAESQMCVSDKATHEKVIRELFKRNPIRQDVKLFAEGFSAASFIVISSYLADFVSLITAHPFIAGVTFAAGASLFLNTVTAIIRKTAHKRDYPVQFAIFSIITGGIISGLIGYTVVGMAIPVVLLSIFGMCSAWLSSELVYNIFGMGTTGVDGFTSLIKELTAKLKSKDQNECIDAAIAIGVSAAPALVPEKCKKEALDAIDTLVNTLGDERLLVSESARNALIAIGESAIEPLNKAIDNVNFPGRKQTILTLVSIYKTMNKIPPPVVARALDNMTNDSSLFFRERAVIAINAFGRHCTMSPKGLISQGPKMEITYSFDSPSFIEGPRTEVKKVSASEVCRIIERLTKSGHTILAIDGVKGKAACAVLTFSAIPVYQPLLKLMFLASGMPDYSAQYAYLFPVFYFVLALLLGWFIFTHRPLKDFLRSKWYARKARSDDWNIRKYAIGRLGDMSEEKELIRLLGNEEYEVHSDAYKQLRKMGVTGAHIKSAFIKLMDDRREAVRMEAAEELLALAQPGDIKIKEKALSRLNIEHYSIGIRKKLRDILEKCGAKEADLVPIYAGLANSAYPVIREDAAKAMGEFPKEASVDTLIKLSRFEHENFINVRKTAIHSLGNIRTDKATNAMIDAFKDPQEDVRACAVDALINKGRIAAHPLVMALANSDRETSRYIVEALARLRDGGEILSLIGLLRDTHNPAHVRASAATILGKLGGTTNGTRAGTNISIELIKALQDKNFEVRRVSATGLLEDLGWQAYNPTENVLVRVALLDWDGIKHLASQSETYKKVIMINLLSMLSHDDSCISQDIAKTLLEIGDERIAFMSEYLSYLTQLDGTEKNVPMLNQDQVGMLIDYINTGKHKPAVKLEKVAIRNGDDHYKIVVTSITITAGPDSQEHQLISSAEDAFGRPGTEIQLYPTNDIIIEGLTDIFMDELYKMSKVGRRSLEFSQLFSTAYDLVKLAPPERCRNLKVTFDRLAARIPAGGVSQSIVETTEKELNIKLSKAEREFVSLVLFGQGEGAGRGAVTSQTLDEMTRALLGKLSDPDKAIRDKAHSDLMARVPYFKKMLHNSSATTRYLGAYALSLIGRQPDPEKETTPQGKEQAMIEDVLYNVGLGAQDNWEAVVKRGKVSIPTLIELLTYNNQAVSRNAAWALLKIGEPKLAPLNTYLAYINNSKGSGVNPPLTQSQAENIVYVFNANSAKKPLEVLLWDGNKGADSLIIWNIGIKIGDLVDNNLLVSRDEAAGYIMDAIMEKVPVGQSISLQVLFDILSENVPNSMVDLRIALGEISLQLRKIDFNAEAALESIRRTGKLTMKEFNLVRFAILGKGQGAGENVTAVTVSNQTSQDPRRAELFRKLEQYINNEKRRYINTANTVVARLAYYGQTNGVLEGLSFEMGDPTIVLKDKANAVIAVINSIGINKLPEDIRPNAKYLVERLPNAEADKTLASAIVCADRAKEMGQKFIFGYHTDWIRGMGDRGYGTQHDAIVGLVNSVNSLGERLKELGYDNFEVVRESTFDELWAAVGQKVDENGLALSNVMLMGAEAPLRAYSDRLTRQGVAGDKRPFLAAIDISRLKAWYDEPENKDSTELLDAKLFEMLYASLELAALVCAAETDRPNSPIIKDYDPKNRFVAFLPQPSPVDYKRLKDRYDAQAKALQSA